MYYTKSGLAFLRAAVKALDAALAVELHANKALHGDGLKPQRLVRLQQQYIDLRGLWEEYEEERIYLRTKIRLQCYDTGELKRPSNLPSR